MVHGLQIPTTYNFLTIMFKVGLQSYLVIAIAGMKWSTLNNIKEAIMLCEEGMTIVEARNEFLVPLNTK